MNETVVSIGIILASLAGLFAALTAFLRFKNALKRGTEKKTVLHVSVPKEIETGPIVAEQIFATMHGIHKNLNFAQRLFGGKQDAVSFEIASVDRRINFYVSFHEKLRNLVEGQMYAQYPDAEILEVEDYASVQDKEVYANAIGAEIEFTDADVFPIKRYTQFEDKLTRVAVDPLSAITSTLTKFNHPSEQAWIQIVITPLPDKWKIVLIKCVNLISNGFFMSMDWSQNAYARAFITRKWWPRIVFFPVYIFFGIRGIFVRAGSKSGSKASEGFLSGDSDDLEEQMAMRSHERES